MEIPARTCDNIQLKLRNRLFNIFESFLIFEDTQKPEIEIVHCDSIYVLLSWLLNIFNLIHTLHFLQWNHYLHCMDHITFIILTNLGLGEMERHHMKKFISYVNYFMTYLIKDPTHLTVLIKYLYWSLTAKWNLFIGDEDQIS